MSALRALLAAWRGDRYAHGFVLLLPAIQYGFNYFVSVAALLFVLTALNTRLRIVALPSLIVLLAAGASLLWAIACVPDAPNLAREARLTGGLLVMFWALAGTPRHSAQRFDGRWALIVLLALSLFTALQWVAAQKGISIFVPQKMFFKADDAALASKWVEHAREHGYQWKLRSAAGFSEPSYLGCVTLLLHFVCLHTLRGPLRWLAGIVAFATCLVAQTYFGLVSNLAILIAFHARSLPKSFWLPAGVLVLSVVALLLSTDALPPLAAQQSGRLERILDGQDVSAGLRLFEPFELIAQVISQAPFGLPLTVVDPYLLRHGLIVAFEDTPIHNGLLNLLFAYGWLGVPLIVLLWRTAGGGVAALFMLLMMAQNGASLDFDKLAMTVFAIQIARHGPYRPAIPSTRAAARTSSARMPFAPPAAQSPRHIREV